MKNRKKSLSGFIQNKRLFLNSRVLAVTAVSSKLGLIVGVNVHIIFGRENLIGEERTGIVREAHQTHFSYTKASTKHTKKGSDSCVLGLFITAFRTTPSSAQIRNNGLPFMPSVAYPPDFAMARGNNLNC